MIKLTLDEKYREMVEDIRSVNNPNCSYYMDNYTEKIEALTRSWFDSGEIYEYQVKVIERIHSADGIDWIAPKYKWRLKSEKVFNRYVWVDCDGLNFCSANCADLDDVMTELEFKKLLEGTGLPFEAFERVSADD
ncbi:hypothetical protein [Latilactobacillus phage TMW 1.46 P1]|nr:hypothetical protein A4W82_04425 [Latilactobacillus sakei]WAX23935.1 hypothetical protein [Latilactobacillus phage TMW 1.46 P1]